VAEPSELFQLKCASDRYAAMSNSTHFKRNNTLVCRVSVRYNHGSTGSKQAYLAQRRVYNHRTARQLLMYRSLNIITNQVQTRVNLYKPCLADKQNSLSKLTAERKDYATTHVAKRDTKLSPRPGVTQEGHC
jgi:hypothetical protein